MRRPAGIGDVRGVAVARAVVNRPRVPEPGIERWPAHGVDHFAFSEAVALPVRHDGHDELLEELFRSFEDQSDGLVLATTIQSGFPGRHQHPAVNEPVVRQRIVPAAETDVVVLRLEGRSAGDAQKCDGIHRLEAIL